jgi:hypothetical protein
MVIIRVLYGRFLPWVPPCHPPIFASVWLVPTHEKTVKGVQIHSVSCFDSGDTELYCFIGSDAIIPVKVQGLPVSFLVFTSLTYLNPSRLR